MIPGKKYTAETLLATALQRKWLIAAAIVLGCAAAFGFARTLPDRYRSETMILVVPQRVPESYVKATVTTRIEDRLQSISQQILSRTRLERVIRDFNLYAQERRTGLMEDIVARMRLDIEIQVINSNAFRVAYTGEDAKTVMQVTERLASLFIEENLRDRETLAEGSYQFLDGQLNDARLKLVEHEKTLEAFRSKYAGQLPSQLQGNLQVIQNTQLQIQSLEESAARDRDRRLVVERAIADMVPVDVAAPATPVSPGATEASGMTTAQQLAGARDALAQLQLRYTAEHPDVIRMKRLVATLETRAAAEDSARPASVPAPVARAMTVAEIARQSRINDLQSELASLDRQIARKEGEQAQLRKTSDGYQARVDATPARESDLISLTRDYDTLQRSYQDLLAKKEDSKVAADMERNQIGEQFKILDPARLAEKPASPNRLEIYALGALLGLLIGFGLAFGLEYLDATVHTEDDAVAAFGLSVLAAVPVLVTSGDRRRARRRRWTVALMSSATAVATAMVVWKFAF